ncbi:MAG: hypothetical protein KatS3mg082_2503 [Nitrospiraceae bacterium]|nr:MAG: hypothetical protein KatS3mg082_2503 [Nitrospiraceae bacterium]
MPVPVLAATYGPTVAAGFFLVQRVWALPASVIGSAVADVFFQRAAAHVCEPRQPLLHLVLRTAVMLGAIAFLPALTLWIWGGQLFRLIFGESWEYAGHYAGLMAPWLFFAFVASPVSRVFALADRPWPKLLYDFVSLATVIATPVLSKNVYLLNDKDMILILSLFNVVLYALYFVTILRVSVTIQMKSCV